MKKRMVIGLALMSVLSFGLMSCEGGFKSALSKMMGGMSSNLYEQMHAVTADTSAANAVASAVSNVHVTDVASSSILSGATVVGDDVEGSIAGVTITVSSDTKLLDPIAKDTATELSKALSSNPSSASVLMDSLSKPVTDADTKKAVNDTVGLLNTALVEAKSAAGLSEAVKEALNGITVPTVDPDNMTEKDVLTTQLLLSVVESAMNAGKVAQEISGTPTQEQNEQILSSVGNALASAKLCQSLGGLDADVLDAETINSLTSSLTGMTGGKDVREVAATDSVTLPSDMASYKDAFNAVSKNVCKMLKVTGTSGNYAISESDWKKIVFDANQYASSMGIALSSVKAKGSWSTEEKNKLDYAVTDIVPYLLSLTIVELDKILGSDDCRTTVVGLLNANPAFVEGTFFNPTTTISYVGSFNDKKAAFKSYADTNEVATKARLKQYVTSFNSIVTITGFDSIEALRKLFDTSNDANLYDKMDTMVDNIKNWATGK